MYGGTEQMLVRKFAYDVSIVSEAIPFPASHSTKDASSREKPLVQL